MTGRRTYRLYGARVAVDPGLLLRAEEVGGRPDVTVEVVDQPPAADWGPAHERYTTPPREGWDRPDFRFFELPDRDVIRIEGSGDVHVLDDTIIFHLRELSHAYLVEIVVLGLAMAFWLERRGTPVLHGSAANIDGAGAAFLANGGTGKSSLSAFLTAEGAPLITEDLLRVTWPDGVPFAETGVAQLRLWPDQAARYADDWEALEQPHPAFAKRKLLVGPEGVGTMAPEAVPLRRIYVLQRTDDPSYVPTVVPLTGAAPVSELLRHSYLPEIADRFGWQMRRLRQLAELSSAVPVAFLRFRSGYDQLDAIRDAIREDLNA